MICSLEIRADCLSIDAQHLAAGEGATAQDAILAKDAQAGLHIGRYQDYTEALVTFPEV